MGQVYETEAESNPSEDRWWIPIGTLAVLFPSAVVLSLVVPPDPFYALFTAPINLLVIALGVLSPIFVHFDKQYVESVSEWKPSVWYYFIILPPFVFLSLIYIYQRHKYVGVP